MLQTCLKCLTALSALAIAWGLTHPPGTPERSRDEDVAVIQPVLKLDRNGQFRGMAVQLHASADINLFEHYQRLIPEIASLGANSVLFVVHGWQEHAGTIDLHIDAGKTANAKELGRLCDLATANGLRIILMPVVLLEHPRNNEWRGKIIPEGQDWDTWFRRYTSFIVHFAKLAERHHVEVLMVGSELIKSETYTDRWRRVIEEVRQHYRGKLGYSANWDHYQPSKIGFWPQLDVVGMTSYYELASGPNPPISEVDENWQKIKKEILSFAKEVGKPIIFTEVGWCSQEGAAHEGWNYYANQKATEAGHREQLMLYESFIKNWAKEPDIAGIIWWEWDPTAGGQDDFNYTPRGKPAEKLLRDFFTGRLNGGPAGMAKPDTATGS